MFIDISISDVTSRTVQSVHLAAGHVIKSFTAFGGALVSSGQVSAIMQSYQ